MKKLTARIEDRLREGVSQLDYTIFVLFNLFKFKPLPKKINKTLALEMLGLGDLITVLPAINALHEKFGSKVDVLIKNLNFVPILKNNPAIGEVLVYSNFKDTLKTLKSRDYDLAAMFHPGSFKLSLLLLLSKAKFRIGCTKNGIRSAKGFFMNRKPRPITGERHIIEKNLDVVRTIGADISDKSLKIYIKEETINEELKKLKINPKEFLVAVQAGAKGISESPHFSKYWPTERFSEVANYLIENYGAKIILTGEKGEEFLSERIISRVKNKKHVISLVGKTSLIQLSSVLKKCKLLVSIDTGTVHVASAMGTPIVDLAGPMSPKVWHPGLPEKKYIVLFHDEVCVMCRRSKCPIKDNVCMKAITVEEVERAIDFLIRRNHLK